MKASESITEIERNLELLNRQHGNVNDENYSKDEEEKEDRNEIENEGGDEDENGGEDDDKEINPTSKKDSIFNYASTSTPLTKKSSISMCDSGVRWSCVLTPVKEDICKKTISCSQCKVVFENKGDLDVHRKEQHDPSLEFSCDICSRTFATEEDKGEHEDDPCHCMECGAFFETLDNYGFHVLNLHQDKIQSVSYTHLTLPTILLV